MPSDPKVRVKILQPGDPEPQEWVEKRQRRKQVDREIEEYIEKVMQPLWAKAKEAEHREELAQQICPICFEKAGIHPDADGIFKRCDHCNSYRK